MKRSLPILTVLVAALVIVACGGSSNKTTSASAPQPQTQTQASPSAGGSAGSSVSIKADPSGALKFTPSQETAKAGTVTLKFSNPSSISHGLSIEGTGIDKDGKVIGPGATSTLTVSLKPGKYTFYCPVPGHRQAGMQGTLTVQ